MGRNHWAYPVPCRRRLKGGKETGEGWGTANRKESVEGSASLFSVIFNLWCRKRKHTSTSSSEEETQSKVIIMAIGVVVLGVAELWWRTSLAIRQWQRRQCGAAKAVRVSEIVPETSLVDRKKYRVIRCVDVGCGMCVRGCFFASQRLAVIARAASVGVVMRATSRYCHRVLTRRPHPLVLSVIRCLLCISDWETTFASC